MGVPQGGHLSPLFFALFVNNVTTVLSHSKILCFADDFKLYYKVSSIEDCICLQSDLDSIVAWGDCLGLSFNVTKCKSMTFSRNRAPFSFSYSINGVVLVSIADNIRDLGFLFVPSLNPKAHIDYVTCKALKLLGFIKRIADEFKLATSLKSLYCALVRPILEYGSVVWNPYTAGDCHQLERVKRKFLAFAAFKLGIPHPPHDYDPVLHAMNLQTLSDRRLYNDLTFLRKLLDGKIDSPSLLQHINFRVPMRHTRNLTPFLIPPCPNNCLSNELLTRCMSLSLANKVPHFSY